MFILKVRLRHMGKCRTIFIQSVALEARRVQNCTVCRGEGLRGAGRTAYGFQGRSNRQI